MSEISDELRQYCKDLYKGGPNYMTLTAIADRIDAEMVELPRDADGELIHIGETVYDLDGYEHMAVSHHLYSEKDPTWMVSVGGGSVYPRELTHERPDSLERIADELEQWSEDNRINGSGEVFYRAGDLAERVRKLAKEQDHE